MSELQDALDCFNDTGQMPPEVVYSPEQLVILDAARKVADPDIDAARESVDMPGVMLLLWRIMELMGVSVSEFPHKDRTGFAMMIRDHIVTRELLDAALGITEDTDA